MGHVELSDTSVNLVESKSFKLYLNSFNQTRFADWQEVQATLTRDLSACAQGEVTVALYRLDELEGQPVAHLHGTCIDDQDIEVDNYEFSTDYLLDAAGDKIVEETLVSHLLKSNCLITHQPDWGSVQIQYRGPKSIAKSCCATWSRSATITSFTSSASSGSSTTSCASASHSRSPSTPATPAVAASTSTRGAATRTLFPLSAVSRVSRQNISHFACVHAYARL